MRDRKIRPSPAAQAAAVAAIIAAALVLWIATTTSLFEAGPEPGAYDAGFEFGFSQASTLDEADVAGLESTWFVRGVEVGSRRAPSQIEVQAVRLVALYVVTAAVVLDRPITDEDAAGYDAGHEQGRADARSGQANRFEDAAVR